MENVIKNRAEILFLYDVSFANPNGDPVDENKPRIDEETGINIVTDVRLKRTIRDYLAYYKGKEVFIIETRKDNGELRTKKDRIEDFGTNEDIIAKCIDVRLFGATTAVKDKMMILTGPVQFKYGKSLHRVNLMYVKGTTVMPSGEGREQGTFTEKYILPYSLIAFYGIVNENAAINQNIPLTDEDVDLMLEGMWNGTKNLMSGSKIGHMPRLLIEVVYQENNYQIGELEKRIKFVHEMEDEEIRDIQDGKLDITELVAVLKQNQEKIKLIKYIYDDRVTFTCNGEECTLEKALKGLNIQKLQY
ncbi:MULTISPECIES: type I-B CRISPR-associated protein Cas7/Csh2 [Thermoanaerobacter]|uniref:CRISPR-associated protein, Csh2 family n=2 Tax=Thermoanaerobacter TaxID=1754 RepID=B0KB25_THEP3|nr:MULTISPECIES: type I-B CRISPR-associated protein Cas7/Csh2 [Thermoanaerobacter]ABY93796.1 CRISPR-associated protein, Csh2 family [Thermoanaerobacter pseudethanolicus ATCC 33223]ADV78760.1 CRISPR-associated protein, Csh2 family [Thermoanaerobacter brockii subsp. finnii Ako-1]HBW58674.1 type I-B CRISPR-associated protein Cas7/Csh2 [Thermoanaerobacter sp.]